ncbi:HAMP domain-containing sensor histidine kinase [Cohnella nanjingensis]|uniref:histidine kinase n=1 Tax=Cohnella nanjingensis TaxID=1387779 RepID=A0A7X0RR51_9BACL|nr:HAMP domain-containing sensor histidine kinase [Cohnella nanjingensis]MBB6672020.1 HAMP domain-containing histidine kinase [Cohnella nanjingensis]
MTRLPLRRLWLQSWPYAYLRMWAGGWEEKKVSLQVLAFAVLSAIAGIIGWRLSFWYYRSEARWLILYEAAYALIVIPIVLGKVGKFHRISKGTEEIATGNLESEIQVAGKDALGRLAASINNMKLGYQNALASRIKSERMKTELITNVSHDLKTPLTSIINYVDLLKKEDIPSEKAKHYVEVLNRKSLRLKLLIDDLFEVSKMASGAVDLDIQHIDVAALLTQAMAESHKDDEEFSNSIRVKIEKPHIYAHLDGNKTWRVFENLIGNAKKYSVPHTRIYISLEEAKDSVIFHIQNTSSYEIDFDAQDLFERFKRADVSRHTEGSGLGLSIVKSIVELQGGEIGIEISGDQFKVRIRFPK